MKNIISFSGQDNQNLLTISDVSRALGVTTQTLRKWDKCGKLTPTRTLGGHRRYLKSDVDRVLTGMTDGNVKVVELLGEALVYVRDENVRQRIERIVETVSAEIETRKRKRS
jgi:excisionase family DNA binding protein